MSGLLRRLTRRRAATADETGPTASESSEPAGAPAEPPAQTGSDSPVGEDAQPTRLIPATGEQAAARGAEADTTPDAAGTAPGWPGTATPATTSDPGATTSEVVTTSIAPAPEQAAARDLPAGVDPGDLAPIASARRGKLRRRLRYLSRVRELLLRDLGGFTYELHRTAGGVVREGHRRLIETKTGRIAAIDAEVLDLEARLNEPHVEPVLREPGIGGTCPECGELYSSDARYCWHCGAPLDAKARAERDAAIRAAAQPATGAHPTPEPQAASVLWAAGPRPQASAGKPEDHSATSQWVAAHARAAPAASEPAREAPAADDPLTREMSGTGDEPGSAAASDERPAGDEPGPAARDESVPDPAGAPGPAASDDPGRAVSEDPGPAAGDDPAPPVADEPARAAGGDAVPAAGDDPAPAVDEPPPDAADQPAASEAPAGADEPGAPASGERAEDEAAPNGQRNQDAPRPLRSGDPLGTRWERPS